MGAMVKRKAAVAKGKNPRPKHGGASTRAKVTKALPAIVDRLVEEAESGSVSHMKLLLAEMGGLGLREQAPPKKRRSSGKDLMELLAEDLEREPEEEQAHEMPEPENCLREG